MARRNNSAEAGVPRLTNDTLKALHAALLLEFPPTVVGEFWRRNPMPVDGTVLSPSETVEHLWREDRAVPLEHVVRVYNDLEWFLIERGHAIEPFVQEAFGGLGRGFYLTPRSMLAGIEPLAASLFSAKDMRAVILESLHLSAERMFPGLVLQQVASGTEGEWSTGVVMVALRTGQGLIAPPVDAELFAALPLRMVPCPTGLPAYEEAMAIADTRPADAVVVPATGEVRNGRFLIDGDEHGEQVGFHELCGRYGFDPASLGIADRPVIRATREYRCRRRGRVVLRAGQVFGAPVILVRIRFLTRSGAKVNPLTKIVRELTNGHSPKWQKAEALHNALLDRLESRHVFVYKSAKRSITVDDRHLAAKVPAKILRNILRAYQNEGRIHFEHRQFVDDPEIVSDPANPNFALRLRRLETVLARKLPDVVLERTGRGSFTLRTTRRLELREE